MSAVRVLRVAASCSRKLADDADADDAGSASVVSAFSIAGLGSMVIVVLAVAGMTITAHRAQSAADFSALAAAHAVADGVPACVAARDWLARSDTASFDGASLLRCSVLDGGDVEVEVFAKSRLAASLQVFSGSEGGVRVSARAGPSM